MQNVNKGLFDQVLRELESYTYCVRWTSENVAARGRPAIVGATWTGYWLDTRGKGVEVHAVDKSDGICCECGGWFGVEEDDDKCEYVEQRVFLPDERYIVAPGEYFPMKYDAVEEYCSKEREILIYEEDNGVIQSPPPPPSPKAAVPSLADAVGYRSLTGSRCNRLDDFRQYAVYHIDDESDSDDDDGFRQTTLASSSSYDEDEW